MKTFNHAFTIAFSVSGSKEENGRDVTSIQMVIALLKRVADCLENNEMQEAVQPPYDTYEE